MKNLPAVAGALLVGTVSLGTAVSFNAAEAARGGDPMVERGRYIAKVAGCNDCHTPNYAVTGGQVPENDWLVGDHVGWNGPFGTTYPANLRLSLAKLGED